MDEHTMSVVLGALLHDIGKFRERTSETLPGWAASYCQEAKYSHEPFSATFLDDFLSGWTADVSAIRRQVIKHHNPSLPDELLVCLADRLSAYERAEVEGDEQGARGRAESVLRTVLSRVELNGQRCDRPAFNNLLPLSLQPEALLPTAEASGSTEAYDGLWNSFQTELARVPKDDIAGLLAVLRKFTWAIPSDTRPDMVPDISLYHHLKSAAAIAACLAREKLGELELRTLLDALTRHFRKEALTHTEDALLRRNICALVKGDVSGTQDFLFLLTSSGAARGLRGRSFYLQLLTETIAAWILRCFRLPETNVLFIGGGHFYLLLPHGETIHRLGDLRQQVARKLWSLHKGDLSLALDFAPVSTLDFLSGDVSGKAFAAKWDEVSRKVNMHKQRKWRDLGSDGMRRELFTAEQRGTTAEEMCQVCHDEWRQDADIMDDNVRKCRRCYQFEKLGNLLRDPTHLVLFTVPEAEPPDKPDWRDALGAFGASPWLVHEAEDPPERPAGSIGATVYSLDTTEFLTDEVFARFRWDDLPVSYDFRWLAGATPLKLYDESGNPVIAEFTDLAKSSDGVEWLGVLRMDVDSLGDVLKKGLNRKATISRMSTLSESLRLFFEGWVPQLCKQCNSFRYGGKDRIYLIYAGGDDVFVVGAWSVLPELAQNIRKDFRAFVGGDQVTLSGGIAIEHQKFPLYQLANDAKYALDDQAKEFKRAHGGHSKDAVSFLRTPMGWERFEHVGQWKDELLPMLRPEGTGAAALPRTFLTRMSEIYALYAANAMQKCKLERQGEIAFAQIEEAIHYDKWQWQLVYHLGRFGHRHKHLKCSIDRLQRDIVRDRDGLISVLHVLARWLELFTREG